MSEIAYEYFIRDAFNVGRGQDPAGLADAAWFDSRRLDKAKAGIIYSMVIYNNRLHEVECDTFERIENYISRVIKSNDLNEITDLMNEYRELIRPYLSEEE